MSIRLSAASAEFVPGGVSAAPAPVPLTGEALLTIRSQVLSAGVRQAALGALTRTHGEEAYFLVVRGGRGVQGGCARGA
jgi:hypothetical protein